MSNWVYLTWSSDCQQCKPILNFFFESWCETVLVISSIRQYRFGDPEPDGVPVFGRQRFWWEWQWTEKVHLWRVTLPCRHVSQNRTEQTALYEPPCQFWNRETAQAGMFPGHPSIQGPCGTGKCCSKQEFLGNKSKIIQTSTNFKLSIYYWEMRRSYVNKYGIYWLVHHKGCWSSAKNLAGINKQGLCVGLSRTIINTALTL